MSFNLYEQETRIIERGKELLDSDMFPNAEAAKEFSLLFKAYKKLFKNTKRLVSMSDRNEEKLNALAQTLDEKNTTLKDLSKKLSKYLSPQVYESIFSGAQDARLTTARKKLTVFFSDIKNFTLTTEDMQPEDLTYLLNTYFTEMSAIAFKHGATVDKFVGDAMLIFFGDPESKGVVEDAKSCVQMAMEMQQRMKELQDIWFEKGYEHPFHMRVGINTGYCNVGNFGSEDRMDYTIIGGEVNLAARLEQCADPDGILMSYETYSLVKDIIEAEERDPLRVKGIRREVKPFAITCMEQLGVRNPKVFRCGGDGFNLFMNREEMSAEDKDIVRDKLESILKSLDDDTDQ